MGVSALQQQNVNVKNTVCNFKHLIGRKFSDPIVAHFKKFVSCDIVQLPDDNVGIKVSISCSFILLILCLLIYLLF